MTAKKSSRPSRSTKASTADTQLPAAKRATRTVGGKSAAAAKTTAAKSKAQGKTHALKQGTISAAKEPAGSSKGTVDPGIPPSDTRPRSEHGRRLGRPRTRLEDLRPVPTRCPSQIYTYLKGITPFLYNSLTAMFEDMIRRFLAERPWEHGLHWRKPKTAMSYAGGMAGKTGWEQVNIQLPAELADAVSETAEICGVSRACLCYTAIFWWVQYIYPPAKMLGAGNQQATISGR
ncbi:hypothetical protein [Paracidovorax citrulli]